MQFHLSGIDTTGDQFDLSGIWFHVSQIVFHLSRSYAQFDISTIGVHEWSIVGQIMYTRISFKLNWLVQYPISLQWNTIPLKWNTFTHLFDLNEIIFDLS
jgi:hypothetical protein